MSQHINISLKICVTRPPPKDSFRIRYKKKWRWFCWSELHFRAYPLKDHDHHQTECSWWSKDIYMPARDLSVRWWRSLHASSTQITNCKFFMFGLSVAMILFADTIITSRSCWIKSKELCHIKLISMWSDCFKGSSKLAHKSHKIWHIITTSSLPRASGTFTGSKNRRGFRDLLWRSYCAKSLWADSRESVSDTERDDLRVGLVLPRISMQEIAIQDEGARCQAQMSNVQARTGLSDERAFGIPTEKRGKSKTLRSSCSSPERSKRKCGTELSWF